MFNDNGEWFDAKEAQRLYDVPNLYSSFSQYLVVPEKTPLKDIRSAISALLPSELYFKIGSAPLTQKPVIRYFYNGGDDLYKEVPVIKHDGHLYIMRPEIDIVQVNKTCQVLLKHLIKD
jgi:hypothetical protein